MSVRAWLAFTAASLALHAAVGAALRPRQPARDEVAQRADAWGGGGEPLELLVDERPPAPRPPGPLPAADDGAPTSEAPPAQTPRAPRSRASERDAPRPSAPTRPRRARRRAAGSGATGAAQPPAARGAPRADAPTGEHPAASARGFGAEERRAPRELLRALTRAVAPANQADAAWSRVAAGSVLTGALTLELDADGRVTSSSASPSTAPPLVELLRRTTFLLRGGTFGARAGEATAGTQRFTVRATVTDTGLPDAEGGAIELSFEVSGGVGRAAFVRAGGRRVDVEFRRAPAR